MTKNWQFPDYSILMDTDSYKVSMSVQYPPGTEYVSSYIESRGGEFPVTVFFGLQMFLNRLESNPVTQEQVDFAADFWAAHGLPFPKEGWQHIVDNHNGRLPIRIQAVEEGRVIPVKNALVQVVNTDPAVPWLTTWVETALLRAVWYPTTVATLSWTIKQMIRENLEATSDDPEGQIGFKLHDFGFRGVSSYESGCIGGLAHLVNFMGTDTAGALVVGRQHYGAEMAGFSIPSAEHSTITAWGREYEEDAYRNMVDQFGGKFPMFGCVSDSFDIYNATSEMWGESLKEEVENSGSTLVVRPDSGDPTVVPVEVIERLGEKFGYSINSKGYKVLAPCVRVIQGDGITLETIRALLNNLKAAGWSGDNLALGMGGGLLQMVNRDTQKWAMKASAIKRDGAEWMDVFKEPVTDTGKNSKRGRQALIESHGATSSGYVTVREDELDDPNRNLLSTVFYDGEIARWQSLDMVRERSNR